MSAQPDRRIGESSGAWVISGPPRGSEMNVVVGAILAHVGRAAQASEARGGGALSHPRPRVTLRSGRADGAAAILRQTQEAP